MKDIEQLLSVHDLAYSMVQPPSSEWELHLSSQVWSEPCTCLSVGVLALEFAPSHDASQPTSDKRSVCRNVVQSTLAPDWAALGVYAILELWLQKAEARGLGGSKIWMCGVYPHHHHCWHGLSLAALIPAAPSHGQRDGMASAGPVTWSEGKSPSSQTRSVCARTSWRSGWPACPSQALASEPKEPGNEQIARYANKKKARKKAGGRGRKDHTKEDVFVMTMTMMMMMMM